MFPQIGSFLTSAKDKFLGTLMPSMGTKTTTASTTQKTGLTSPVVTNSPSATVPTSTQSTTSSGITAPAALKYNLDSLAKNTVTSSPKEAFIASATSSAPASQTQPQQNGNVTTPSGAVVNSQTGQLVSAPPVDQNQKYVDAFEQYIRSLSPSPDETNAESYLRQLLDTSRREEEKALNMGETLGFASGEASRVNKNRAFDIMAATGAVDAFKSKREALTNVTKARADYEKSLIKDTKADGVTLSPGQKRYEYDPVTKSYKEVAAVPEDPLDNAYRQKQIENLQSEINKRNADTGNDSQFTIPKTARNNLLKYGLKATEVDALQADIRQYGLSKALEGIDEDTALYITEELDKPNLAF